jgi:carbon-monoxide dehydrogenase medium subunit
VPDFDLHAPRTLHEASQLLAEYEGEARPIAGGTALVLMLRQGLLRPRALVRLDRVPGLDSVRVDNGLLRLGAMVPLHTIVHSPLVRTTIPLLAQTCNLVGNVRVRNAATIGGNLCEADYASDPPTVLVALDARVRVQGCAGARELAVAELIQDFYETSLAPDELVSEVQVPVPAPGTRGVYLKFVTRSAEDRPCVGVAALVRLDEDERVDELRVAVGAVAGRPLRLPAVEQEARGSRLTAEALEALAQQYAAAVEPVSDARGSAAYRRQMIAVFVRRALRAALAGATGAWQV